MELTHDEIRRASTTKLRKLLKEDILKNKSLSLDHEKFQSLMKESKELAKKNWKGSGDSSIDQIWFGIKDKVGPTEFLGYEFESAEGVVQSILKNNEEIKNLDEGDEGILILNQTPFYGESGGQVGDSGTITSGDNLFNLALFAKSFTFFARPTRLY